MISKGVAIFMIAITFGGLHGASEGLHLLINKKQIPPLKPKGQLEEFLTETDNVRKVIQPKYMKRKEKDWSWK